MKRAGGFLKKTRPLLTRGRGAEYNEGTGEDAGSRWFLNWTVFSIQKRVTAVVVEWEGGYFFFAWLLMYRTSFMIAMMTSRN